MGVKMIKKSESINPYFLEIQLAKEMNIDEYFRVVRNYVQYYYKRATLYKIWYLGLSVTKLLILAMIPISQTFAQLSDLPWIATGASSLCILLESVIELFRMKEKWVLYRKVGNDLMREERQYVLKAGGYQDGDEEKNFRIFVTNAENIIGEESSTWKQMIQNIKVEKV
ncbi:MAG: DUF4231 domain-containing protein [Lachnospiraceae bacterium]|nr:DUF4231 domain-containing protein [Lachnospiraceae bacterium]